MNKKTVRDVDLKGKKVIMRVDFNVPLNAEHQITDDTRIKAAEPTIKYVLEQGAALILMSHLGRPKGKGYEADFSLRPVCDYLSKDLGIAVQFAEDCQNADAQAAALQPGQVLMLENTRFYKAEEGKVKKTDRAAHDGTVAYEYGLKQDREEFDFSNLHDQSLKMIRKPLTKFLLMRNYFAQALKNSWSKSWASSHEPIFNFDSVNENCFYDELSKFMESFAQWLEGMAKNKRSFKPFDLETTGANVFNLVKGITPEKHFFGDKNFDLFNNRLDKNKKKLSQHMPSIQACWMDLFARTTDQLVSDELHL